MNGQAAAAATSQAKPRLRYAAIDLGTNNCRLMIVAPKKLGFRVTDAFSQIVRLGEGMGVTGRLSGVAMDRTLAALSVCAQKIKDHRVTAVRCVATQACRSAINGAEFLQRVEQETGLRLEIVTPSEEAALSVQGCFDLIDVEAKAALVFDIGGGSTEISWLRVDPAGRAHETAAWTSLPIGVVSMAEKHGDKDISASAYAMMAQDVVSMLEHAKTEIPQDISEAFANRQAHIVGTSGTLTSLAAVHLDLTQYSRCAVDGLWMSHKSLVDVSEKLRASSFAMRANNPCIGENRADLVVPGCAILAGILQQWPVERVRVGDRGLREGILKGLLRAAKDQ